jgi:hypothetical protein
MLTRNLYNLENDGINQVSQMFNRRPGYMVFVSKNKHQFGRSPAKGTWVKSRDSEDNY